MNKKGDVPSGSGAAALILIIAILMIFYLLFIPPDIRDEILEGDYNSDTTDDDSSTNIVEEEYLFEVPGTIEEINDEDIEHWISPIYIFSTEESEILALLSKIKVKQSLFGGTNKLMTFDIDDKNNLENVRLALTADEWDGNLIIYLNDKILYDQEIYSSNIQPINLDVKNLKDGENVLLFKTSDIGWKFWKSNEIILLDTKVTADVTDISEQKSQNTFIVSEVEKNNAELVKISFVPDCNSEKVGMLTVSLNNHIVYDSIPDCNAPIGLETLPDYLRKGENTLTFKTYDGSYLIDLIKIKTKVSKVSYPIYYFEIPKEDLEGIENEETDLVLKIKFVDDTELKDATMIINGVKTGLYQYDKIYDKKINDFNIDESNSIKIIPNNRLEIAELTVFADSEYFEDEDSEDEGFYNDYMYYCHENGVSIYMRHKGDGYNTGWDCLDNEKCEGNSRVYDDDQDRDVIRRAICE